MRAARLWMPLICLALVGSTLASARPPEESEFAAAEKIGEDIADWLTDLDPRPNSIGIFYVYSNYPLEQDYATVVETEIMKSLARNDMRNVISCSECRANQVNLVGDRVVISKGAPDLETMKRIGRNQPVENFLMVELYRTKLSVIAHAVLYRNPSGVLVSAEKFRVTAVSFSDAATQLIGTIGLGWPMANTPSPEMSTAFGLALLEELGFAKGGLHLGMVSGAGESILSISPTLAFRGRFGRGYVSWMFNTGFGYAFVGSATGFAARGGFDITLGSTAIVGVEGVYFINTGITQTNLQGFAGIHVGFSLGR